MVRIRYIFFLIVLIIRIRIRCTFSLLALIYRIRIRLVPVISEIVVTEKLGSNFVKSLMPKRSMFGEDKEVGFYYRPTPDGQRILLGGRRMHKQDAVAQARLHQGLAGIFPELEGSKISIIGQGMSSFPLTRCQS